MPTSPRDVALFNAAKRRRTPRIARVVQDGTTSLTVIFDRSMDETKTTSLIRTCGAVNGVVDWTDGTWSDDRTFVSTSSSVVDGFAGTRRAIYLSGDLRAKGRFTVDNRERCDRVEDA